MRGLVTKKNIYLLLLLVISLLGLAIIPTYAKFPSNYITDEDIVGMSLDFNIGISNIEEYEEIIVPANSSEQFNIEIENAYSDTMYYGVWYRMISPSEISEDILIGKLEGTETTTSGTITSSSTTTVSIAIVNNTDSNITVNIGVASSTTSTSDIEYLNGKHLITDIFFPLNTVEAGSYVAYTGNNGCTGDSCKGYNANYVSDTDIGYCSSSDYKFITNGWRIGYTENSSAYLVSAGATDCMCTSSDGTASNSSCSDYLSATDLYKHFDNMNNLALNYCNSDYVNGGVCNNTTTWAMDADDFEKITGSTLEICLDSSYNVSCGYNNDLIDNGGYYWFATAYSSSMHHTFLWISNYRRVAYYTSGNLRGVRPVIYLDSTVYVTGGSGTYEDPYTIAN